MHVGMGLANVRANVRMWAACPCVRTRVCVWAHPALRAHTALRVAQLTAAAPNGSGASPKSLGLAGGAPSELAVGAEALDRADQPTACARRRT